MLLHYLVKYNNSKLTQITLSCWKDKELSRHFTHRGKQFLRQQNIPIIGTINLHPWVHKNQICEAKLWDTDPSDRHHHRPTERCLRTQQTLSSDLLLLDACWNIQTVILRIPLWRHRENFLVGEPDKVHFVIWEHLQQFFGALQANSSIWLSELLHTSLLHAFQTEVIMDNAQHGRLRYADFSGNLAYGTMCLWLPFLTQNQLFDGRYIVFSAGRSWPATPLLPISRPCSVFPVAFSGGSPIHTSSNFLWELTHQFCRPTVFQQIQIFYEHFILITEHHFWWF